MRFGTFQYSMTIDGYIISIAEQDDRFDLRINSQPFSLLYLNEKTKSNFKQEGGIKSNYGNEIDEPNSNSYIPHKIEPNYPKKIEPKPKKPADNGEFKSGFEQFDYKPAKPVAQHAKPYTTAAPRPVSYEWRTENPHVPPAYMPAPAKNEFSWDNPSDFQFEDPQHTMSAPVAKKPEKPGIFNQPKAAAPAPVQQAPPPPPPKKEEPKPIIDFLDSGPAQSNALPDDLFEGNNDFIKMPELKPKETTKPEVTSPAKTEVKKDNSGILGLDFDGPPTKPQQAIPDNKPTQNLPNLFADLSMDPKKSPDSMQPRPQDPTAYFLLARNLE